MRHVEKKKKHNNRKFVSRSARGCHPKYSKVASEKKKWKFRIPSSKKCACDCVSGRGLNDWEHGRLWLSHPTLSSNYPHSTSHHEAPKLPTTPHPRHFQYRSSSAPTPLRTGNFCEAWPRRFFATRHLQFYLLLYLRSFLPSRKIIVIVRECKNTHYPKVINWPFNGVRLTLFHLLVCIS